MIRIVLDTNVLVATGRSRHGASYRLAEMIGPEAPFQLIVSVPLVLEYEMALKRRTELRHGDCEALVDYICQVADRQEIYFLWRPFLKDPADEMVLEVAVGGAARFIVSHNLGDFEGVQARFGISVVTPREFLLKLEMNDK